MNFLFGFFCCCCCFEIVAWKQTKKKWGNLEGVRPFLFVTLFLFGIFTRLTCTFVKEALGTTMCGITPIIPPNHARPSRNRTWILKSCLYLCANTFDCLEEGQPCLIPSFSRVYFWISSSVGLAGRWVDVWEPEHASPTYSTCWKIRRYISRVV